MGVCKDLITRGNYKFVGMNEMCAGKKKTFPPVKVWEKIGASYTSRGTERNFFGNYTYKLIAVPDIKKHKQDPGTKFDEFEDLNR